MRPFHARKPILNLLGRICCARESGAIRDSCPVRSGSAPIVNARGVLPARDRARSINHDFPKNRLDRDSPSTRAPSLVRGPIPGAESSESTTCREGGQSLRHILCVNKARLIPSHRFGPDSFPRCSRPCDDSGPRSGFCAIPAPSARNRGGTSAKTVVLARLPHQIRFSGCPMPASSQGPDPR